MRDGIVGGEAQNLTILLLGFFQIALLRKGICKVNSRKRISWGVRNHLVKGFERVSVTSLAYSGASTRQKRHLAPFQFFKIVHQRIGYFWIPLASLPQVST